MPSWHKTLIRSLRRKPQAEGGAALYFSASPTPPPLPARLPLAPPPLPLTALPPTSSPRACPWEQLEVRALKHRQLGTARLEYSLAGSRPAPGVVVGDCHPALLPANALPRARSRSASTARPSCGWAGRRHTERQRIWRGDEEDGVRAGGKRTDARRKMSPAKHAWAGSSCRDPETCHQASTP